MNPAFSVILLTTLIGAGQGLFLAMFTAQVYALIGLLPEAGRPFYAQGSTIAVAFLIGGLIASFFHLGHPERAWRSAARWRTSWLSREVIVLPAVIVAVAIFGIVHYFDWTLALIGVETPIPSDLALIVGVGATALTFLLFVCTGMIYACIKFLQEWATPLTVVNYTLLGTASGFTLATAFASHVTPGLTGFFGGWALVLTAVALVTRSASLIRNRRIKFKSNLQTAIGVRHTRIVQKAQGFMGGSFNTREFFHGKSAPFFRSIKWIFLVFAFPLPAAILWWGLAAERPALLVVAFVVQYLGLVAERWFFFAQANHPQNLYYQAVS